MIIDNMVDYNDYTDQQLTDAIAQLTSYKNAHAAKATAVQAEVDNIDITTNSNMQEYVNYARQIISRLNGICTLYDYRIKILQNIIDKRAAASEKAQAEANYAALDTYCQEQYNMTISELIIKMRQ